MNQPGTAHNGEPIGMMVTNMTKRALTVGAKIGAGIVAGMGASIALSGCAIVPQVGGTRAPAPQQSPAATPPPPVGAPVTPSGQAPSPENAGRHRIALLVPISGTNGDVGQSIANATTMAMLDTEADNLRITVYDTATGASSAAATAIADGNRLILGPLLSENVRPVLGQARPADVPLIAFTNDANVAGPDVFVMGHIPEQSIAQSVGYARKNGAARFMAIVPEGEYGDRAATGFADAVAQYGGAVLGTERYSRGNTSIVGAARRVRSRGGFDAVLIADNVDRASRAASELGRTQIIGTELWSGEGSVTRDASLRGAIFSAVSDARYKRFSDTYEARFSSRPYRISTLGYDAVLLTLRVAQEWQVGDSFPIDTLRDRGGFLGLDGPFRFERSGVVERAMEVRAVRDGRVVIAQDAPTRFQD